MYRSFILLVSVLLLLGSAAEAQNLRCSYQYQYRNKPDEKFRVLEQKLDCFDRRFAFYAENVFLADSLENLAFDENGKALDNQAYAERIRMRSIGFRAVSLTDQQAGTLLQCYQAASVFVIGSANLELPAWEIQADTCTVAGYRAQKAVAEYLGRRWEIWYAPDLPVSAGPWLLWGAPGLIVRASDADDLFQFELQGTEELESPSRIAFLKWFHLERKRSRKNHFDLPLLRAESIYYKMRTDVRFLHEAAGLSGGRHYRVDSSGEKRDINFSPYTPLIPLEYGKNP